MNKEPNKYAFPKDNLYQVGLTKREYFAAMAMQGILAHAAQNWNVNQTPEDLCRCAVQTAEALIEELNKEVK